MPAAWGLGSFISSMRARLISGLIFSLPIVITFWIVYWIFLTIERFLLTPLAGLVNRIHALMLDNPALDELPKWWFNIASPILAIVLALGILYILGLVFRSWLYRTLDWFLLHVPIVATIYKAVRNVVESLGSQLQGGGEFKRVVLVEFPHPGTRSLGLVTNSLRDVTTGRNILTVCVLTGLMPPAGFTLFVPEESVTNIAWSVNETLQSIISGGITAPPTIHFFEGLSKPLHQGGGPIVDAHGHVLRSVSAEDDVTRPDGGTATSPRSGS
ncbi:MAG: DUF502 domain-containing protein [Isosphaerales bacterium]